MYAVDLLKIVSFSCSKFLAAWASSRPLMYCLEPLVLFCIYTVAYTDRDMYIYIVIQ